MSIILDNDIITVIESAVTVQSTATGFNKVNVMNHAYLKRRWRMDALTKSDTNPVMYFDMSSAQTVAAIVLDDVNFDKVIIKGHATSLTTDWTAASFTTTTLTVSKDMQTDRYKIYIPLTSFNFRWLAIIVPTTATAVGSYTSKWEIGRVVLMDTATEFSRNMSVGYERGAERAYSELELASGHLERNIEGEIKWTGTLYFNYRKGAEENDLTTLNNMDIGATLVFYENNGDTSKVYICLRDDNYSGTYLAEGIVQGSSIKLRERI